MEEKLNAINDFFNDKKVLVAFSGGADSTLLAILAKKYSIKSLAVTFDNGTMPQDFIENSKKIADNINIKHHIIRENLLKNFLFASNSPDRCYVCKDTIYEILVDYANDFGFDMVVDGTNISDIFEERPGIRVNREKGIQMPFLEAGMTSNDVRRMLAEMKIEYSSNTTCLATRVLVDNVLNKNTIDKVQLAENLVSNLTSQSLVRVRYDKSNAILEVGDPENLLDKKILSNINHELKKIGFKKVFMNIEGYKTSKNPEIVFKAGYEGGFLELELPYAIDINKSYEKLDEIGLLKCSSDILELQIDKYKFKIGKDGKIIVTGVKNEQEAEELLASLMPSIIKSF
jgi:uncharacterized protein